MKVNKLERIAHIAALRLNLAFESMTLNLTKLK